MKFFIPQNVIITDSSIAENEGTDGTIYPFVVTDSYAKGVRRYYGARLWESFTVIHPLSTYSWNDLDPNNKFTTRLSDNVIIDSTTVPVTTNTIVYVYTEEKYYQSKQNRTVDFTTEAYDPANWDDNVGSDYRYEWSYPQEDSIYWKDLGATNRNKCADKAINTQSQEEGTESYFEFLAKNINEVILFNFEAESARIQVYNPADYDPDTEIGTPIYDNIKDGLLNTTSIINWRTLSQYEQSFIKNVDWNLPFFVGEVTVRITLANTVSTILKLGEILMGQTQEYGITLDGVPTQKKSSGKIVQKDNGEVIFEDEGDITKIYDTFDFSISYDSPTVDSISDKSNELINRRVVVFAENTDKEKYRSLVVYGFSRDVSYVFKANNQQSKINLKVQRFV